MPLSRTSYLNRISQVGGDRSNRRSGKHDQSYEVEHRQQKQKHCRADEQETYSSGWIYPISFCATGSSAPDSTMDSAA